MSSAISHSIYLFVTAGVAAFATNVCNDERLYGSNDYKFHEASNTFPSMAGPRDIFSVKSLIRGSFKSAG